MIKLFVLFLHLFLFVNVFTAPPDVIAEDSNLENQKKENLDVSQINSSVDAGSFYSVEVGIKQMEENIVKMTHELKLLKQQVEFAKQAECKYVAQIQKLEQDKAKLNQALNQALFDNTLTGSAAKLESAKLENMGGNVSGVETKITSSQQGVEQPAGQTPGQLVQAMPENASQSGPAKQDVAVEVVTIAAESNRA